MSRIGVVVAVMALSMMIPVQADAFSGRIGYIPNGACDMCHVVPGGPRTAFGQDVEQYTNRNQNPDWSELYDLDSDGDGYTNGEELGDAYGQWSRGDQNPTQLSEPHEAFDTPDLVGNAPTLTDATVTVAEDESYQGTLQAADADGDDLRLRIATEPEYGTLALNNRETGEYTYTPDADYYGDDSFTFQAFDGNNIGAEPGVISITVTPVNDLPTITTDGDQTVEEDDAVIIAASAQDPEDGTLAVAVDPLPEGAEWDVENQRFVWTPNYFQSGTYTLEFSATDEDGATATETVTIEVTNVNRRPEAELVEGPQTGSEGSTYTFTIDATDPDLEELTYNWAFGNGDELETQVGSVDYAWGQDGTFNLRVVISDGDLAVTRTYSVVIANVAPIVTAGDDRTIDEGQTITLLGTVDDPGFDDDLTIAWTFGNGGTSEELQPSYAYGDNGTFTATLSVDDGTDTGTDTATITVNNVAPTVDAGGNATIDEGSRYTFNGTYEDPGFDDVLTVLWDFGNDVTSDEGTYTYGDQGTYTVSLTVTDDDGGSDTDTITATVVNVAPTFLSDPPLFAPRGREYSYTIEYFEPGDDTVSYELLEGPEGMELTGRTVTYTPDPDEEEIEVYTVSLRIYDEDGGENTQTYTLTVGLQDRDNDGAPDECEDMYNELNGDDPEDGPLDLDLDGIPNNEECIAGTNPTVSNAPTAPSISNPLDGQLVTFQRPSLVVNNSIDPDEDALLYTFQIFSDRNLNDMVETFEDVQETPNRTQVTLQTLLTENQSYYWRVRAYDGRGYSPYTPLTKFIFSQVNDPPSVPSPVAPQGTITSAPVFETLQAVDPEGQPLTYDFQVFFDLPDNQDLHSGTIAVIGGNLPRVTWTSPTPFEENTRYRWRVRAGDPVNGRSEWSDYLPFFYNAVNAVPTQPQIISPDDGVTLEGPSDLIFVATAAQDEDLDTVTHAFRLATGEGFGPNDIVISEGDFPAGPDDEVTWDLTGGGTVLEENTWYYWDVRSYDGGQYSPASSASFLYSSVNESPEAPTARTPSGGVVITDPQPEFVWSNTVDPEGGPVTYLFELHANRQATSLVFQLFDIPGDEAEDTRRTFDPLDDNATYYWRVRAVDAEGNDSAWSDIAEFTIAQGGSAPSQPILTGPVPGTEFTFGDPVELSWKNSTDDEGDPITYTVEVLNSSDQLITTAEVEPAAGENTTWIVTVNLAAGTYNWRVRAAAADQSSPWSNTATFDIIDAPEPPSGGGDSGGCAVAPGSTGSGAALLLALIGAVVLRRKN
jgi:MYXO-CTERM domain-containing protein